MNWIFLQTLCVCRNHAEESLHDWSGYVGELKLSHISPSNLSNKSKRFIRRGSCGLPAWGTRCMLASLEDFPAWTNEVCRINPLDLFDRDHVSFTHMTSEVLLRESYRLSQQKTKGLCWIHPKDVVSRVTQVNLRGSSGYAGWVLQTSQHEPMRLVDDILWMSSSTESCKFYLHDFSSSAGWVLKTSQQN